jgi:sortase A
MTLVLRIRPFDLLEGAFRWTRRVLYLGGISILAYCAYVTVDAWRFEKLEDRLLTRQIEVAPPSLPPLREGGLIGRVEIPRIGLSSIVLEGDGDAVLRHGAGHIPGTLLPGGKGNVGIAAHRDTLFRPLRNIQRGDLIRVTTLQGDYLYSVKSTRIVDPTDVAVLHSDGHEVLTLVTCYPFYYVGSAPKRFIVRAERVSGTAQF